MNRTVPHLLIFVAVALTCGWAGVLLDRLVDTPEGEQGPGMLLWLVAPLLAVVVLRWRQGSWADAGLRPRLPQATRWYAVAVVLPIAIAGVVIGLAALTGTVTVSHDWTAYATLAIGAIAFNLVKNMFEEFAWRGYLTPRLDSLGIGDGMLYLIVGLVWGLWHLPYYLFLLDVRLMANTLDAPKIVFALLAVIVLTGWSVVLVELFRLSSSVWPPLLLHTVHNSFVDPIVSENFVSMPTWLGIALSPTVGLGTAALWVVAGLWLRSLRLRSVATLAPATSPSHSS
ncbi:MAG: CPBP family intramembrane glutamic endopeptidase [Ornithinimicrobium sp.]